MESNNLISSSPDQKESENLPAGFGAFFFPDPVTVGNNNSSKLQDLDNPAFQPSTTPLLEYERSNGTNLVLFGDDQPWKNRNIVYEHDFPDGKKVVVSDDGFIGVFELEEKEAKSFLNTVFATASTWGIKGQILEDHDVCHFRWFPDSKVLYIDEYDIPSERMLFSLLRYNPNSNQHLDWKFYPRRPLSINDCKQILNRAFDYTTRRELQENVILLLEAYTLFTKNASKGTFLYGWMIIETFLAELWKEYVNSLEGRSKKDKETLLGDVRLWTSYHHIEMFAALGKLNETTVRLFHQMRRKRNSITHKREDVEEREARGCLSVATKIIVNRIRNQSPFLELEKNDLVEFWNLKDKSYEKPASEG